MKYLLLLLFFTTQFIAQTEKTPYELDGNDVKLRAWLVNPTYEKEHRDSVQQGLFSSATISNLTVGNLTVTGSNALYGGMFIDTNTTATSISADSTWTIVSQFETGSVNGVTYDSDTLTVNSDGLYLLSWHCSAEAAAADDIFRFGVGINDAVPKQNAIIEADFPVVYATGVSATAILDLDADDQISFQTMNLSGTGNITIKWANVIIVRL